MYDVLCQCAQHAKATTVLPSFTQVTGGDGREILLVSQVSVVLYSLSAGQLVQHNVLHFPRSKLTYTQTRTLVTILAVLLY